MSSKIFEEAIADAKKLREVAEDNAKKAILESVTPKIREFIEGQLLENEAEEGVEEASQDEVEEMGLDEDVFLDESALGSLVKMLGGTDILPSLQESSVKNAVNASVREAVEGLSGTQQQKLLEIANKINNTVDNLTVSEINNKVLKNEENSVMTGKNFYEVDLQALREALEEEAYGEGMEEEMEEADEVGGEGSRPDVTKGKSPPSMDEVEEDMDEMDMDEMLNELRLVLDLGDDIEADAIPEDLRGMIDEEDEEGEDVDMEDEDAEGEEEGESDDPFAMMGGGDEEPPPAEESFVVDANMLREELARVRRALREGKVDHHFGGKGGGSAGVDGAFGGKGKKNAGVRGAFGGGSEGQDVFTNPPSSLKKLNEAIRELSRQNRAQKEKLNKYRSAVQTLREQLEDLNLFNAKLLYVNKLLQNKNLTESQKKSVIKALDESTSLNEAKSLYKSLTETFAGRSSGTLTESRHVGSSSRLTTSSSSSSGRANGELDRWQKLAGLK